VISSIWRHGGERRRLDDNSISRYWRCRHCKGATVLKVAETGGGQTSYATRHLRNKHHINIKEDEAVVPPSPSLFSGVVNLAGTTVASIATKGSCRLLMFGTLSFGQSRPPARDRNHVTRQTWVTTEGIPPRARRGATPCLASPQ
jgi:hypothetical protein